MSLVVLKRYLCVAFICNCETDCKKESLIKRDVFMIITKRIIGRKNGRKCLKIPFKEH